MPPIEIVDVTDLGAYYTSAAVDGLLAAKSAVGHVHVAANITDFNAVGDARWSLLAHNHTGVYSPVGHTHVKADITDFAHTHPAAEITDFNAVGDARWSLLAHTHTFASKNGITGIGGVADATTYLRGDGNWSTVSASPGGADTQVMFNDAGVFGGDAGLVYNKTTNILTNTGGNINIATGSITASNPFSITQTWNNAAVVFTGMLVNITNTASNSASKFFECQLGGSMRMEFTRAATLKIASDGSPTQTLYHSTGVNTGQNGKYTFSNSIDGSGTIDTGLARNAAGIVEINNGTAGTLRDLTARALILTETTRPITIGFAASTGTVSIGSASGFGLCFNSGDGAVYYVGSSAAYVRLSSQKSGVSSTTFWGFGAVASGTLDVAFYRNAAGIIEVNDGVTANAYREIKSRSHIFTGTPTGGGASLFVLGGTMRTTIGANGAASALTALPIGYVDVDYGGTIGQIPVYNRGA